MTVGLLFLKRDGSTSAYERMRTLNNILRSHPFLAIHCCSIHSTKSSCCPYPTAPQKQDEVCRCGPAAGVCCVCVRTDQDLREYQGKMDGSGVDSSSPASDTEEPVSLLMGPALV